MPPDVHCPTAPICFWAATLAGGEREQGIRADERRLLFRELAATARDLEFASRKLLELTERREPVLADVLVRVADMRRLAGRVVRALDAAAVERNAA